jgi:hypothetical protein
VLLGIAVTGLIGTALWRWSNARSERIEGKNRNESIRESYGCDQGIDLKPLKSICCWSRGIRFEINASIREGIKEKPRE